MGLFHPYKWPHFKWVNVVISPYWQEFLNSIQRPTCFAYFSGGDEKGKVEIFREHKGGGWNRYRSSIFLCTLCCLGNGKPTIFFWTICCIFNFSKKPKTNTKGHGKVNQFDYHHQKTHTYPIQHVTVFFWLRFACSVVGQKYNIFSQIGGETWWFTLVESGKKKHQLTKSQGRVRCMHLTPFPSCPPVTDVKQVGSDQCPSPWPLNHENRSTCTSQRELGFSQEVRING